MTQPIFNAEADPELATTYFVNKQGRYVIKTSPVTLVYPHLTDPDTGVAGKFVKDAEFTTDFVFNADDPNLEETLSIIRTALKAAYLAEKDKARGAIVTYSKNAPFKSNKIGQTQFTAKLKQTVLNRKDKTSFEQAPQLFDENKKPWVKSERGYIANGAVCQLVVEVVPYNLATAGGVGATLRLKAVRVLKQGEARPKEDTSYFGAAPANSGSSSANSQVDPDFEDDIPF